VLNQLLNSKKVVGIKQLRKALGQDLIVTVFLALDADPMLLDPIRALCEEKGVPVVDVPTMQALGKSCGIAVGASAAGILR
jgi:large subunit ribosomal protein L7A